MALIRCPECGREVSTAASSCPGCGYPIVQYAEEILFNAEVKRLTEKIQHVEFICPEPRGKVCIKCGKPFFYSVNTNHKKHGTPMCECHIGHHTFPGVEIDYPEQQQARGMLSSHLYIHEQCVISNNIGDTDSPEYHEYEDSLYEEIRRSEKATGNTISPEPPDEKYFGVHAKDGPAPQISYTPPPPKDVPACPYCHSTDLIKISNAKKTVKAIAFGIFGALDDAGKTWKCNNCGSKF